MKPGDFYMDKYIADSGKRTAKDGVIATRSASRLAFYDGVIAMKFLNYVDPPTKEDIAMHQLFTLRANTQHDPTLLRFLNSYNNKKIDINNITTKNGTNVADAMEAIEMALQDVYLYYDPTQNNSIGAINTDSAKLLTESNTINFSQQFPAYQQLLGRLIKLEQILSQDEVFLATNAMKKELSKIQSLRIKLEEDINKFNNGITINNSEPYISSGDLYWLVRRVKGRFYETSVKQFLSQALPNRVTVDTANVMGKNEKRIITAGADIISFTMPENITNAIQLSWHDKKGSHKGTIFDFLNYVNNNQTLTIQIDEDEYAAALDQFSGNIAGIQVKAGMGQGLLNNNATNAKTLQDAINAGGLPATILSCFNKWYQYKHIYANNEVFNLYFDYQMAHYVQELIGKNSSLVATRDGIMTVADYFDLQWKARKKYIKAIKKISIGSLNKSNPVRQSSAKVF